MRFFLVTFVCVTHKHCSDAAKRLDHGGRFIQYSHSTTTRMKLLMIASLVLPVRSMALFSRRAAVQQALVSSLFQQRQSSSACDSDVSAQGSTTFLLASQNSDNDIPTIQAQPDMKLFSKDKNCDNNPKQPSDEVLQQFESESCYGKNKATLSIVVQGASGDLAKKMTFPAIYDLYANKFIPEHTIIIGYARSDLSDQELRDQLRPFLEEKTQECGEEKLKGFLDRIRYVKGSSNEDDFEQLANKMSQWEKEEGGEAEDVNHNRLYYFAIPPSVFLDSAAAIKAKGVSETGWTRLVVEKPFGRDLESAKQLASDLSEYFSEDYIYRIDHYLGQEMVQNMLTTRFGNIMFEPVWNRDHIESVTFNFKEDFGTKGRGGYFDEYGMIRDVVQNHLLQVFCMVAMEPPVTLVGPDVIRDEKLKVLKSVKPIKVEDVVLGQYSGNKNQKGYTELDDVPKDSKTETFASVKLFVENRRWDGVPFIFNAGKALDEHKVEVIIKFKDIPGGCQMFGCDSTPRNELVMQLEPENNVSLKVNIKKPGLQTMPMQSNLDLSYSKNYPDAYTPDPYVRLLLEVLRGKQATFVRRDELLESWRVFTPVLEKIEEAAKNGGKVDGVKVPVKKYKFGTVEDWMGF